MMSNLYWHTPRNCVYFHTFSPDILKEKSPHSLPIIYNSSPDKKSSIFSPLAVTIFMLLKYILKIIRGNMIIKKQS